MDLETFINATSALTIFVGLVTVIFWKSRTETKSEATLQKEAKMKIHNSRTNKIYGCVVCGTKLEPEDTIFYCGSCPEEFSHCVACHKIAEHSHRMFEEKIYYEVDPSSLEGAETVSVAFTRAIEVYGPRPLLGKRNPEDDSAYKWINYTEVGKRVMNFGAGLSLLGAKDRDVILLCSISSIEWYITDYACLLHGYIILPLHPTVSLQNIVAVLKRAKPSVVVVSVHLRETFLEAIDQVQKEGHQVQSMILIDDWVGGYIYRDKNYTSEMEKIYDFETVQDLGILGLINKPFSHPPLTCDDIVMLLPTSGSSGNPKLTIITNSMLLHQVVVPKQGRLVVMYSFEPLRQSLDVLSKGGSIGCWSGSVQTILNDCCLLRPTVFGATPALWNGFYRDFCDELELVKQDHPSWPIVDCTEFLKPKWSKLFGNRCRTGIIVGAASSKELKNWIFNVLNCVVMDGYGTTETGGLSGNSQVNSGISLQLHDCPALGYLTTDNPPRGEVLAHTSRLTPGYYNDEEATKESFVDICGVRFFRTGDIGEMENGQVKVIDRISSVFKLSQGFFVPPTPLENLYIQGQFVEQIFIYGDPSLSSVVAVVIPSDTALESVKNHFVLEKLDLETLCVSSPFDDYLIGLILRDMRTSAKAKSCKPWEIPGWVVLEHQRFSSSNGLLTTIGKLCRPALIKQYRPIIHRKLGVNPEDVPTETKLNLQSLATLKPMKSDLNEGILVLLSSASPTPVNHICAFDSLSDLGFDSISLTRLSNAIKNTYQVSITVPTLAKFPTLFHLQMAVFGGGLSSGLSLPPRDSSTSTEKWRKEAETAWRPLEDWTLSRCQTAKNPSILLTGATGFLGGFLLKSILSFPFFEDCPVYCIVRAVDNQEAFQRIKSNLELYSLWSESMTPRIVAIKGDLELPLMGVSEDDYKLLKTVNIIYHNGAVVNSLLPYKSLYNANVIGTQNLLKLAFEIGGHIQFHYVSTIGLLAGSGVDSESDIVPPIAISHLSGYSQSKWVAEQLIFKAVNKGLNCRVYRPGTIFSDRETGACNKNDSVILMVAGLARERMYCTGKGSPLVQRFPLVPVDWVADSITQISHLPSLKKLVFHLVNRDPVPLERLMQGLSKCGFEVQNVSAETFKTQIANLPDDHPLFVFQSVLTSSGFMTGDVHSGPTDMNTLKALMTCNGAPVTGSPFITDKMIELMILYSKKHGIMRTHQL